MVVLIEQKLIAPLNFQRYLEIFIVDLVITQSKCIYWQFPHIMTILLEKTIPTPGVQSKYDTEVGLCKHTFLISPKCLLIAKPPKLVLMQELSALTKTVSLNRTTDAHVCIAILAKEGCVKMN